MTTFWYYMVLICFYVPWVRIHVLPYAFLLRKLWENNKKYNLCRCMMCVSHFGQLCTHRFGTQLHVGVSKRFSVLYIIVYVVYWMILRFNISRHMKCFVFFSNKARSAFLTRCLHNTNRPASLGMTPYTILRNVFSLLRTFQKSFHSCIYWF